MTWLPWLLTFYLVIHQVWSFCNRPLSSCDKVVTHCMQLASAVASVVVARVLYAATARHGYWSDQSIRHASHQRSVRPSKATKILPVRPAKLWWTVKSLTIGLYCLNLYMCCIVFYLRLPLLHNTTIIRIRTRMHMLQLPEHSTYVLAWLQYIMRML